MIRRGPRPADRFAMIANEALENSSLTWRARGVLAYLLSRPEGWSTSAERLAGQSPKGKEGRDAMRSVLAELEAVGYIVREKAQDARGRWSTSMVVHDFPAKTAAEPTIVESEPSGLEVLQLPDSMSTSMDDGSGREMAEIFAKSSDQPLILEPAKNGGSPVVGSPAVGSPAVGKPGLLNKKETKTENKKDSSSTSPSLRGRMDEVRRRGGTVVEFLPEIQEALGWVPPLPDLVRAEKQWAWSRGGWRAVEVARDYVMHCRKKSWTPNVDGWWRSMDYEDKAREIRTRGRAYSPDGVPL